MNEEFENEKSQVDLKQIEREFHAELGQTQEPNSELGNEAPRKNSPWDDKDFISDDALRFVLGLKNGALVSMLAKGMGKTEKDMLSDLYKVTVEELKVYKSIIQNFIRENFPDYMDKISKITNGDILAITLLELGRWREAKILVKASKDKNGGVSE